MNSGFNYAVYPTEGTLGIGLDWFLGPEHPIVGTLAPHMFPQYMRNRMQPDLIPAAALRGWLLVHFSNPWYRSERCVDELLYWGKILFILEQCLPDTPQHSLLDWSQADWDWAEAHERDVWLELQPQDALFASDRLEFGRWFPKDRSPNLVPSRRKVPIVWEPTWAGEWCPSTWPTTRDNASAVDDLDRLYTRRESYRPK